LRILQIRPPKWTLFNARLAEMGSGAHRPGCDFGRVFDHQFSGVFELDFRLLFLAPLERRFAGISVFSVFGAAARTCFWPTFGPYFRPCFRHLEIQLCSLPHKNSLDVCLPIANKSVHPLRVRSVAK
jgi:hypothetical protein